MNKEAKAWNCNTTLYLFLSLPVPMSAGEGDTVFELPSCLNSALAKTDENTLIFVPL